MLQAELHRIMLLVTLESTEVWSLESSVSFRNHPVLFCQRMVNHVSPSWETIISCAFCKKTMICNFINITKLSSVSNWIMSFYSNHQESISSSWLSFKNTNSSDPFQSLSTSSLWWSGQDNTSGELPINGTMLSSATNPEYVWTLQWASVCLETRWREIFWLLL